MLVCLLVSGPCGIAAGSTALLRFAGSAPDLSDAQTYAGAAPLTSSALRSPASLTVVLLADSLTPVSLEDVKKQLLQLPLSLRGMPVRLALLQGGSFSVSAPLGRVRLKAELDKIQPGPDASAAASAGLIAALAANAVQLGSDWSPVLLVGELPPPDPATSDYAAALLVRAFTAQRLQVSWFAPSGVNDAWLPVFQATGGALLRNGLLEFTIPRAQAAADLAQLDWTPRLPSAGFVLFHSIITDQQGQKLLDIPDLSVAPGASLPSVEQYSDMRSKTEDAAALLGRPPVSAENAQRIREDLQAALNVNPRDPQALAAAAEFYEQARDYATAATLGGYLVEVRPLDGAAYAAYGHALQLGAQLDKAEAALQRATQLGAHTPGVAEDFARIHLARKDDQGAIPYLQDVLRSDDKRQDLWFLEAEAADRLRQPEAAIRCFEQGLALGGVHVAQSGSLVRLYLAERQEEKASTLARQVIAALPPEPAPRAEFAAILDGLDRTQEALLAWKRVLEVQPDSERAYSRVAALLLGLGDLQGARQAAEAGLAVAPSSPALYLVDADALEKQGEIYGARNVLEQGATHAPDPGLLQRFASTEDTYGGLAAAGYARLSQTLAAASPQRLQALQRGLEVSLRDGDRKHAESFAAELASAGHPESRTLLGEEQKPDSGILVPGGLDALAFAANAKQGIAPDKFFVELCRALIDRQSSAKDARSLDAIREHFQRLAALEPFGKRDGNRVLIKLSLQGKESRRATEKVLALLGIKLRSSKEGIELQRGEKKSEAERQETVSALALDEVGLQDALAAGKTFTLEIPYQWAALYPSEQFWRDAFYKGPAEPGAFPLALVRLPKLSRLYVGINSMDRKAVPELLAALNVQALYDRYADLLYAFAPAFGLDGKHAMVPGGAPAEEFWSRLAGAAPDHPGAFFRALLEREDGKLLAFFFTLSQLDGPHQAFFTANFARVSQFYKLFLSGDEMQHFLPTSLRDSSFMEFLRAVPLDSDGHVRFPGSAEVWTVAKGSNTSDSQAAKMLKKVSRAVAPDVEDEVLLRLARLRYRERSVQRTELDNFLSVSRIDVHRSQPLDPESALLLAQHYGDYADLYSYFTDLTALSAADFRQFFAAADRISAHPPLDANLEIGQLHALVEWICLLRLQQVIDDAAAAKLFRQLSDRFASADGDAGYTAASLESARAILASCQGPAPASPDDRLRRCLLPQSGPAGSDRDADFRQVLEAQKVPSLDGLFAIHDGLPKLLKQDPAALAAIDKAVAALPAVDVPKQVKTEGREKDNLARYAPAPLLKTMAQLREKAARRKFNSKDVEKLSQELLAELEPQVTLALAGPVYAWYLRPKDLVVSDDPLLLRKHHYLPFSTPGRKAVAQESDFHVESQGIGSYFEGGFAQFALASGAAAAVGWKIGGHSSNEPMAAQIASLRTARWDQLRQSDLRLLALRVEVAREWILESSLHPAEWAALGRQSMGLLSPARRAELLNGIETRDWPAVWESVTLPDLFALGGRYLRLYSADPWSSPVTAALRSLAALDDGSRLSVLAPILYRTFGCDQPHLLSDAPYEEYARHFFPADIAEREAEFKFFLAFQADSLGVAPPDLAKVAEPLAAKAFGAAQMTDSRDWRALLAAFSSIGAGDLKEALQP